LDLHGCEKPPDSLPDPCIHGRPHLPESPKYPLRLFPRENKMSLKALSFHIILLLLFQSPFNDGKDSVDLHLLNHKFNDSPEEYIEVSRPINYPANNSFSIIVLKHDFGNTYGKPPVEVSYSPPAECSSNWDKVVLQWRVTCKGEQYDRIAGVWLSGVEILRTSTAEPTEAGISWEVNKDITRYHHQFPFF
jgi:hypothetical protein